ncbi:MAG: M55 family metallopeptidase [Clostridia bacterium]|nr:M55 family metallopeptidase [Clostridia bacterium]
MGLKVYIQTDIEGVAGVVEWDPRISTYNDIEKFHKRQTINRLLTQEVNAAVRAAADAGADTIYVNDSHGDCKSIDIEMLDPAAELIHGMYATSPSWLPCLDSTVDCVVAVGMHAMAGSAYANLPHTMWHINDDEYKLSEATMCAALAGYFDVPYVFASGDQTICKEIKEKIPECYTAEVKQSLSPYFVRALHPEKARKLIYDGVKEAIINRDKIKPFKIFPPYKIAASNRKPEILLAPPMCGDDFFKLVHDYLNQFPSNDFGTQNIFNKSQKHSPYSEMKGE